MKSLQKRKKVWRFGAEGENKMAGFLDLF